MAPIYPDTVWNANQRDLLSLLDAHTLAPEPKVVHFYAPSFMHYTSSYFRSARTKFPTVSVTGTACALNCRHCGGRILQTMHPADTPEKLFALATELRQNGAVGCLVSGGCLPDGSVPLTPFISIFKKIKRELGLTLFVHTGIIDYATAAALKIAGVDAALIDIIGSDETIQQVCNLKVSVKDYTRSLNALHKVGLNFVPHVIVGLHDGKLKGEIDALKIIAPVKPSAIVVIAFMPIHGTAMANAKPPTPADIARVIATARLMFPETPLVLGCMRPKGKHRTETDTLALKAGVDAIAFPSEDAFKYAKAQGFTVNFSSYCCARIYMDAETRRPSK